MAVTTYDASTVTLIIDGKYITGFDEGSMVEWSKDEDNINTKIDAQGNVSVAINNNTLGTITVNLSQSSPSLAYMKQLANTKKRFPIWAQGGSEKIGGTEAMVKKTPDGSFSDESEARSFEIQVFDYSDK